MTQLGGNIPELRGAYKFETLDWAKLFSASQEKLQDVEPEKEAVETADKIVVETSQPEGTLAIHEAVDPQVETLVEDANSVSQELAKVQEQPGDACLPEELSSCQAVQHLSLPGTEKKSRESASLGDLIGLALRYPELHGSELCERYQEAVFTMAPTNSTRNESAPGASDVPGDVIAAGTQEEQSVAVVSHEPVVDDPMLTSADVPDGVATAGQEQEQIAEVSCEPVADDHVLTSADEPGDVVAGSQEKEKHAEVSHEPAADDNVPTSLGGPGDAAVCSQEEKVIEVSPEPVADDPEAEAPGDAAVSQVCLAPSTEDHSTPTLGVPCDTSSCHGHEKDAAVSKKPQRESAALVSVINLLLRHPGLSGAELAEKARESGEASVGSSDSTSVAETSPVDHAQLVSLIGQAINSPRRKSPRRATIA